MSMKLCADDLALLGVREIIAQMKGILTFSHEERQKKELLLQKVVNCAPQAEVDFLHKVALEKRSGIPGPTALQKRKREKETQPKWTVWCLDNGEDEEERSHENEDDKSDPSKYLVLPTDKERKASYCKFYEATSATALTAGICGVCARECGPMDESLHKIVLSNIPNSHCLISKVPHPAHDVYESRLLQPEGVEINGPHTVISICQACLDDL